VAISFITLTTDFGTHDTFVGQMKGVILTIAPDVRIIDVTHSIPPQDIIAGALAIESALDAFASETIHVAVVDPGVGTRRAAIAVETNVGMFVGPDNGIFTAVLARVEQRRAVALTNTNYHHQTTCATFHGRDVFAPVAAHLALGTPLVQLGKPIEHLCMLDIPEPQTIGTDLALEVTGVDHFGNLITNLTRDHFDAWRCGVALATMCLSIGDQTITGIASTFADVAPNELVAYFGSTGRLQIAIRNGHAASHLGADQDRLDIRIGTGETNH